MKVWICSDGEYSDRKNRAVFSDEIQARLVSLAYGWNEPIPFEVDSLEIPSEVSQGLTFYSLAMVRDSGKVIYGPYATEPGTDACGDGRIDHSYNRDGYGVCWHFYLWARHHQHAVKIAADRRTSLLAHNQDLPPR